MGEFPSVPGSGDRRKRAAEARRRRSLESGKSENARHVRDGLGRVAAHTGGLKGFSERMEKRQILTKEQIAAWLPVCREEFSRAEYARRIEKALDLLRYDLHQDGDARQHESIQVSDTLVRASRLLEGTTHLGSRAAGYTDLDSQDQDLPSLSFTTLVRTAANLEEGRVLRNDDENWLAERNELIKAADVAADYFVMVDMWQGLEQ